MKKILIHPLIISLILLFGVSSAHSLTFTFSDVDYIGGQSWGTMEITVEE